MSNSDCYKKKYESQTKKYQQQTKNPHKKKILI